MKNPRVPRSGGKEEKGLNAENNGDNTRGVLLGVEAERKQLAPRQAVIGHHCRPAGKEVFCDRKGRNTEDSRFVADDGEESRDNPLYDVSLTTLAQASDSREQTDWQPTIDGRRQERLWTPRKDWDPRQTGPRPNLAAYLESKLKALEPLQLHKLRKNTPWSFREGGRKIAPLGRM